MLALLASLDISNKNDPATWMFQFYLSHIIEDYAPVLAMTNKEKLAFLRRGVEKWVDPFVRLTRFFFILHGPQAVVYMRKFYFPK